MRRILIAISSAAVMLGALTGTASASTPASCVGIITAYEASQLPAGSIGREVSGLATSAPGLGHAVVSPLAREHLGSIAGCSGAGESNGEGR